LVTAVEAANGVMVGVNRESASAGSAAWNFAVPKATVFSTNLSSGLCVIPSAIQLIDRSFRPGSRFKYVRCVERSFLAAGMAVAVVNG
jgi:hypothetical protein